MNSTYGHVALSVLVIGLTLLDGCDRSKTTETTIGAPATSRASSGSPEQKGGVPEGEGKLEGSQAQHEEALYHVMLSEGGSGYIDRRGKIVIKLPSGYSISILSSGFSDGLAIVDRVFEHGYIDKAGTICIEPQFNYAEPFQEGLAAVGVGGGILNNRYGFIDKTGKYVINPRFQMVGNFSEGLAAVCETVRKWGFIDKTGKYVIEPRFSRAGMFTEGLAPVEVCDATPDARWGFIDKSGSCVIDAQFGLAKEFSKGLAAVRIGDDRTGVWGYIDKAGKLVINPQFQAVSAFAEGMAAVRVGDDENGKWGFIDRNGRLVIRPQFRSIHTATGSGGERYYRPGAQSFSEGLAAVYVNSGDKGERPQGSWGFIDKTGAFRLPPQYSDVYSSGGFSNGLVYVRLTTETASAYIDATGKVVWKSR